MKSMLYSFRTSHESFKFGHVDKRDTGDRMNEYCSYDVTIMWFSEGEGNSATENKIRKELKEMGFTRQKVKNPKTGRYRQNEFFSQPKGMKAEELEKIMYELMLKHCKNVAVYD